MPFKHAILCVCPLMISPLLLQNYEPLIIPIVKARVHFLSSYDLPMVNIAQEHTLFCIITT